MKLITKRSTSKLRLSSEFPWKWWEAIAIGALALIGADIFVNLSFGILAGIIAEVLGKTAELERLFNSEPILLNFVLFAAARGLGFWLIWAFLKRRNFSLKNFGFKRFKFKTNLLRLIGASLLLIGLTTAVFYLVSQILPQVNLEQEQEVVFTAASGTPQLIMAFLALVVIAPLVEEMIFRGLMLPPLIKRFGLTFGIFFSSLLFAAIHLQINVAIVTFIMGWILAWLYLKSRSLVPAIIFHSLKNLVAFGLIFY